MTDPGYSNAPAAAQRPAVVTVSSYLLYAAAAVMLLNALISLAFIGTTADVTRDAYRGTAAEGAEGVVVAVGVAAAVLYILFAAGLAILALFNNRGKNASRIVTWVVGGLAVCCGGLGSLGGAVGNSMSMGSASGGANMPDAAETQRRLDEALPGWYTPVTTTLMVLLSLCALAAVILLALPAANAFFRRPAATWNPPAQGYPPYPAPQQAPPYPAPPQQGTPPYPAPPQQGTPPYPSGPYPGQQTPPGQTPPGQGPQPGGGQHPPA